MRKPLIGIIPLYDEEKESYWMLPGYMQGIEQAGGVPVMLPLTAEEENLRLLAETMDGFLFTGGHDVDPALYGEAPKETLGPLCRERDAMEAALLPMVMELDKPFLGICRGIQLINAVLGGSLYQDLPSENPSPVRHHETPPYDKVAHTVRIEPDTPLFRMVGTTAMGVNSYHHQGIKTLAPCLRKMAEATDGVIEAVYAPGKTFAAAVQWHPEFSFRSDENSRKIFAAFVAACQKKGAY